MTRIERILPALALMLVLAPAAYAQDVTPTREIAVRVESNYSPFLVQHCPARVLSRDPHVPPLSSSDAGVAGNRLGPDVEFRRARREEVHASSGRRRRWARGERWQQRGEKVALYFLSVATLSLFANDWQAKTL